jgi:hypothetical protein
MHDVLVTHVLLDASRVVTIIGQLVAGCVPQHVGVNRKLRPAALPSRVISFRTLLEVIAAPRSEQNT